MKGEQFEVAKQKDGRLKISLTPKGRREVDFGELRQHGSDDALETILESYSTNGSFATVLPFDVGALTSSPIIAESVDYPDKGGRKAVGDVWWFPNYQVEDPLDTLETKGVVYFKNAGPAESKRKTSKTSKAKCPPGRKRVGGVCKRKRSR